MSAASSSISLALLGHPNSGKTALFNLLTGSRQKVANYAGVTVERKEGQLTTASGQRVRVLDLPGAYSLNALSADEAVTRDVITGQRAGEALPELLVCVVDATNLRMGLRMVLETRAMGRPMVLALNMSDAARRAGIVIDRAVLERELGMAVVETVGIQKGGAHELLAFLDGWRKPDTGTGAQKDGATAQPWQPQGIEHVLTLGALARHSASQHPAAMHAGDAAQDWVQAWQALQQLLPTAGSVLVKGSRFMGMDRIVQAALDAAAAQQKGVAACC